VRTIIAGGRDFKPKDRDWGILDGFLKSIPITEVISGHAAGADQFGEAWAAHNKIPLRVFPAKWKEHGKQAGYLRNVQMADVADAVILFPGGKGTAMMEKIALAKGLRVFTPYWR